MENVLVVGRVKIQGTAHLIFMNFTSHMLCMKNFKTENFPTRQIVKVCRVPDLMLRNQWTMDKQISILAHVH